MAYFADVRTIPHGAQRYDTVGDYWTDANGVTQVRVSRLDDWRQEFLVAIHELIEKALTRYQGISEETIDRFDLIYEEQRPVGDTSEPGDHWKCPYHDAHVVATVIEMALAGQLDVDWQEYEKKVEAL